MTIQPKKPNIREARDPGPRQKESPRTEQPRDARGQPTAPPPTYEELFLFHDQAIRKLDDYTASHVELYRLIDAGQVDEAKALLTSFPRQVPKLGDQPEQQSHPDEDPKAPRTQNRPKLHTDGGE